MGRDGALQPRPVLRAIGLGPLPSASASRSAISPTGEEGAESVISRIGHPPIRPVLKAGLLRSVSTGLEKHVAAVTWTGVGFVGWVRNATAGLARGISTQCRTIAASTRIVRGGAIVEKCAWSPRGGHIGVAVVSTSSRACGAGVRTVEVLALPSNVTLELVDNGRSSGEPLAKRSSLDAMTPASSASPASSSFVPSFSSAILSPTAPPINRLAATASPSVLGGAFVEISVGVRGEGAGSIPSDVDRAGAGRRRGWLLAGSRREDGGSGSGTGSGWGRGWKEEVAVDRKDTCESVNDKDGGANGGQGGGDEGRLRQRVGATIRSKFSGNALAGALAGGLVSCCLHPIDTVKTVVQSERGAASSSLFPVIRKILADRGIMGLYRGLGSNFATAAPISAIYTSTYESVKEFLLPCLPKKYHSVAHCVAGGCASVATSFVFTPSECVKQRLQVGGTYTNSWAALVGILQSEGLCSLYAGWGAVLCRNVPQSIIKFLTYEQLKQWAMQNNDGDRLSHLQTLAIGGTAGSTAAFFTTPFDVIKTRLQTQVPGLSAKYNGVGHALTTILAEEGISGLYRGVGPRLFIYVSQGAIFFASYEFARKLLSTAVWPLATNQATERVPTLPVTAGASSEGEEEIHPTTNDSSQERQ